MLLHECYAQWHPGTAGPSCSFYSRSRSGVLWFAYGDNIIKFQDKNYFKISCLLRYLLPDCAACSQKISPIENTNTISQVKVNGKSYHTSCFNCSKCFKNLAAPSSEPCMLENNSFVCKSCYTPKVTVYKSIIRRSQMWNKILEVIENGYSSCTKVYSSCNPGYFNQISL